MLISKTSLPPFLLFILLLTACKKDTVIEPTPEPTPLPKVLRFESRVKNLQLPWGIVELPDGSLLFSERPGKIYLLKKNETTYKSVYSDVVQTNGEGGMLSLAIDPDFENNHFVYAYITTDSNRVIRFTFLNEQLTRNRVILGNIPKGNNHDGGALRFGPDGYLYIGTGDVTQPNLAQDLNSLAGKILRIDRNGQIPSGNPFQSPVWSYGHRNVQGFCWTTNGTMLATEHGPSLDMGWVAHDEINVIEPGRNYGWPLALGGTETGTLTAPLLHSGDDTWAPSGCTYLGESSIWPNCLVVACLRGQKLLRIYLQPDGKSIKLRNDTLLNICGRLRNVLETKDKNIYVCTSNYGSGSPTPIAEDDKIYQLYLK